MEMGLLQKNRRRKDHGSELETHREGALRAVGDWGSLHGLLVQSTIPGHGPTCKGILGSWSDLREASWGGEGCYALLRACIPSCHQRAELGKSVPLGRRQASRLTSCQEDAMFETETGHLECRRLHKLEPPGALTGVIVPT